MLEQVLDWIVDPAIATALVVAIGYFFRDVILRFVYSKIEGKISEKLEATKSELRGQERELEQIRSFLLQHDGERLSLLQEKRYQAAEEVLKACVVISKLAMAVEFMKVVDVDWIERHSGDENLKQFFDVLLNGMNVDESLKEVHAAPVLNSRLYLDEKSLKHFEAYKLIVLHAVTVMKLASISLKDGPVFKADALRKPIVELVPNSEEGFEKFGDTYGYHWSTYFFDETIKSLRKMVHGDEAKVEQVNLVTSSSILSVQAQARVREHAQAAGVSPDIFKKGI